MCRMYRVVSFSVGHVVLYFAFFTGLKRERHRRNAFLSLRSALSIHVYILCLCKCWIEAQEVVDDEPSHPTFEAKVDFPFALVLFRSSPTMAEVAALANVLVSTLSPDAPTRRQAERELLQAQAHPSFGQLILQLAQDGTQQKAIRQAAALNFKNWIKANWAVSTSSRLFTQRPQAARDEAVLGL